MTDPNLDVLFDPANYLYFNHLYLTEERTEAELAFLRNHLALARTSTVLDLGCGHGRHSIPLANEVMGITALDINTPFLAMARASAVELSITNVQFVQGDILDMSFRGQFDAALMLNTIFGLLDDAGSAEALSRVAQALKPGGQLCFDVVNRDTILVHFRPHWIVEREGNYMLDRLYFDQKSGRMHNDRVYVKDGKRTPAPFSLRMFNYTEIEGMLRNVGLSVSKVFSNWRGEPFDFESKAMVIIAEKRA